jgi:FlaA1/EpsC-like NDP-sugar epimerase
MLVNRLSSDMRDGLLPVALIDDDPGKQGMSISGVRVCGKVENIPEVAEAVHASDIVIAIPSADEKLLKKIYDKCIETKCTVKIFQSVVDVQNYLAGDKRALRDVSIEDLLFRDTVKTDMSAVFEFLIGKTVLVTGGAGSIGSEICNQVLEHGCKKLVIFDIDENGVFRLNENLRPKYGEDRYVICFGSVRDKDCLAHVFAEHRPDIVFHAAAHKHVPIMELNPAEAVKNNVFGTRNVITLCSEFSVKKFVLISTDKAVNPTNVMGATKRLCELLVHTMNGAGGCEMAAVRFGNVLGSNGSVIPLFKKQIADGGPVTVTHRDMRRYFMTIPEAVSLVLTAGALAKGGELFVLDMGTPVKIYDLAENLIRLSGLTPGEDIEIKITGLRPGEKLFEELSLDSESVEKTQHSKIFVLHSTPIDKPALDDAVDKIHDLALKNGDTAELRKLLFDTISQY